MLSFSTSQALMAVLTVKVKPDEPMSRGAELWAKYTVREFCEAAKRLEAQYQAEYLMLMQAMDRRPPGTADWAERSSSRSRRPHEVAWTVRGGGREVRTQSDLNNGLIHAAKGGQTNRVIELLKAGAKVSATVDWRLNTALHEAAAIGDHQTCAALLEAGSDVNAKNNHGNNTPLHLACLHGDPSCVQLLLKAGADIDALNRARSTPIHMIEARTTRPEAVRDSDSDGPEKLALESRLWAKKGLSVKDREIREIVGKRREYLRREAEKGLPVLTCETMPPNWLDGSEASSKLPSQGFVNPFGSSRFASMVSLKSFRMDACLESMMAHPERYQCWRRKSSAIVAAGGAEGTAGKSMPMVETEADDGSVSSDGITASTASIATGSGGTASLVGEEDSIVTLTPITALVEENVDEQDVVAEKTDVRADTTHDDVALVVPVRKNLKPRVKPPEEVHALVLPVPARPVDVVRDEAAEAGPMARAKAQAEASRKRTGASGGGAMPPGGSLMSVQSAG
mmetsp:Transcript_78056/g.224180  ORF Transcript_78056/g.224180 Transcript_78056/m.224180 type:complete len:511 (+) Transcript_78056:431-1963(+)